jgi:hypothetical protein
MDKDERYDVPKFMYMVMAFAAGWLGGYLVVLSQVFGMLRQMASIIYKHP